MNEQRTEQHSEEPQLQAAALVGEVSDEALEAAGGGNGLGGPTGPDAQACGTTVP